MRMKVGDLVRHKKGHVGVITKHQIFQYYTVVWASGREQHSVKSTDLEVISESR